MPQGIDRETGKRVLKTRQNTKGVSKKPRLKGNSLLILECDAKKLTAQLISMAEEIRIAVQLLAPKVKTEIVQTTTEEDLKTQFARLAEQNCRFKIIVVIGHRNASGLILTADKTVSWTALAKWVEIFEPERMALVACQAGQMLPARDIFAGLQTLKEIYASPIKIRKPQSEIITVLVPYLLRTRSPDSQLIRLGQIINFLLTSGVFFRWTRREFKIPRYSSPRRRT